MLNKSFFIAIFFTIIFQIVFSFYYSSEIINQNNLINQNQTTFKTLKLKNQDLEKKLAILSSLTTVEAIVNQKNYINLKDILDLQN